MKAITVEKLLKKDLEKVMIVDVRTMGDYSRASIEGSVHIPRNEIFDRLEQLDREKEIYILDYNGKVCHAIAEKLCELGYEAAAIIGGYRTLLRTRLEHMVEDEEKRKEKQAEIEHSIIKKFRKPIWRKFTKAIREYELVKDGDKIAVCISGGKDSMLMAKLFQELRLHGQANFDLEFLVMNPGYHEENFEIIQKNAQLMGIPLTVFSSGIFDTVVEIDKNPCYLCARMRRGYLYSKAQELGCNKIALGHHFDDVIETILMGMLYGGKVETMMPKLHSQNFEGMELIRPLYLIKEEDVKNWRDYNGLGFLQCACHFTENVALGDGETESKRDEMKELIAKFRQTSDVIEKNIFRSVHNVNLRTIIGYHRDEMTYNFLDDYDGESEDHPNFF